MPNWPARPPSPPARPWSTLLRESGDLAGEPTPTTRKANFYEKGDKPLEIVSSRQWYIRNGGRDDDLKQALLARGERLDWVPDHMRHRYTNWVNGLNGDWLISRQRYFGVPFPVWYPVDAEGEPDHSRPIFAAEDTLPVDPSSDVPPGFDEAQRGQPGGFVGDPDVMDTWATSSLTPQIVVWLGQRPAAVAADLSDGLRPAGPRDHPHLGIRTGGACALRRTAGALEDRRGLGLRGRPGPQEDE